MVDLKSAEVKLHADLGYKRLNRTWAKAEIFLGLLALAIGIWLISRGFDGPNYWSKYPIPDPVGVVLFVLGGYLTLAGHRSHMYQASNLQVAYLLSQILQMSQVKSGGET